MAAPNPSRLDANQVLQGSFDEDTGSLRTTSNATVVNADIDVALDATEDNVEVWLNDVIIDEDDAQLVKSVISAQDPAGVFQNIKSSGNGNILVAIGDRPAEVRSRVRVESQLFNTVLTSTATVVYTVTPGKILYVESMIISAVNTGTSVGEWRIADGGIDKIGYLLQEQVTGAASTISVASPSLPEPIPFTTNFGVREVAGDVSLSVYFIGYEE